MTTTPGPRSLALALALTLLTVGLAGCIGPTSGEFESFADARDAAHATAQPEEAEPLKLGLIEPETTDGAPQGKQNVTFVLWNTETGNPVEDASVTLDAFMPMMGHGTNPEEDPEHLRNGVYRGSTNLMMGGDWILFLNATLASGQEAHFQVDVNVTGDGGHGGMDHGHGGHGMHSGYDSYEDAKTAEGETFAPEQNSSIRLKLLEPAREGLEQGETNVTVLLFDQEADEPVTNGTAYLNATMSAMGHGTSPEKDPMHTEHGVWKGKTTFSMNGTWVLGFDVQPQDSDWLRWEVNVTVGNGSMDHGDANKTAFEPYEKVFEDDISGPNYDVNHTLPVKAANATLTMNGSLENATPLDEVTVELYDTEDNQLGSFTLTSDANETSLEVQDAPTEGDYAVRVHGTAVDAHYRVAVNVAPP